MSKKVAVPCPHCGSVGTYQIGFSTGSGTAPIQCNQCRKGFRIEIKNGDVYGTKK